jgi:formate hydrogenlyase subunit 6/NADH:ubiquinone oxidoreductase subunit I
MQLGWIVKGLRTGRVTTRYPAAPEPQPGLWRGRPVLDPRACRAADGCRACVAVCLPDALRLEGDNLVLDYGRCVMCGLCVPACPAGALRMEPDYELAVTRPADLRVAVRLGSGNGRESDGR